MVAFNPYAPVMRDEANDCYVFYEPAGKNNERRSLSLKIEQEKEPQLKKLLRKESLDFSEAAELFGEDTAKQMVQLCILEEAEREADSIYTRSAAFYAQYGFENAQDILKNKRVLILGCGGIGTHLAWQMAVLGVGTLTLLDYDVVEKSNLNRQILFDMRDLGKSKAQTLKEKIQAVNPEVSVFAVNERIVSKDQLEKVCTAQAYDLIIKALDSPTKLPLWLDEVCKSHSLPYVAGLTLQDRAMIGPTFIPEKSRVGYSDLIDVCSYGEKVFGTVSSLGLILNEIASEMGIEAFKVLLDLDDLKYLNKIEVKNLFSNRSDFVIEKRHMPFSVFQKNDLGTFLNLLVIGLSCGCQLLNPWIYLLSFFLCILMPNLLFETKKTTIKGTSVNIILVTIFNITRSFPAMMAGSEISAGILVFQLLFLFIAMSMLVLIGAACSGLVFRILKR